MQIVNVEVVEYDGNTNDLICRFPGNTMHRVDPFVGCVVEQTEDNAFDVGKAMEGKKYRMICGVYSHGAFLPDSFDEIQENMNNPED